MMISFVHFSLIGIDQTGYYTAEINMTTASLMGARWGESGLLLSQEHLKGIPSDLTQSFTWTQG